MGKPVEMSDEEVFGGQEMSDEEVFGTRRKTPLERLKEGTQFDPEARKQTAEQAKSGLRGLGLVARGALKGLSGMAQQLIEPIYTAPPGMRSKIVQGIDPAVERGLTKAGLPEPETTGEKVLTGAGEFLPAFMGGRGASQPLSAIGRKLKPEVVRAVSDGYKVTPEQAGRGVLAQGVQGFAGSAKLERLGSKLNQKNTNELINQDFGFSPAQRVRDADFDKVRRAEGAAYEEVKKSAKIIKPDTQMHADLQGLRGDFTAAAKEYPELMSNKEVETLIDTLKRPASPTAMVELTKKLRRDAATNLKSFDDPTKRELGFAQRGAAIAIENMIDRALTSIGKPDLVAKWQKARTTIAKSYDAQAAFNEATGNYDARVLARMSKKGKPLSGGMEKAANFAKAFEAGARPPEKLRGGTEFDYGDILFGSLGGLAGYGGHMVSHTGTGLGLALTLGLSRPATRHLLMSKAMQPGLSLRSIQPGAGILLTPGLGLRPPAEE